MLGRTQVLLQGLKGQGRAQQQAVAAGYHRI